MTFHPWLWKVNELRVLSPPMFFLNLRTMQPRHFELLHSYHLYWKQSREKCVKICRYSYFLIKTDSFFVTHPLYLHTKFGSNCIPVLFDDCWQPTICHPPAAKWGKVQYGKSEGFDSSNWPSYLAQIRSKSSIFQCMWPWNLTDDLIKQLGTSSTQLEVCEFILELQSKNTQFRSKSLIFWPRWPWNLIGDLIYSHLWSQTGDIIWKHLILVNIFDFSDHVTLKFDIWPSWTIGHFFCATSSLVHHFVAICQLKVELQSGKSQFGSNHCFLAHVTLKFEGWP